MENMPELIDGLPNICGSEDLIEQALRPPPSSSSKKWVGFDQIQSGAAIALHMHQPLIPAGGADLQTAAIISNLKYMMDNPQIGDNHNAPVFHWCYRRMGEFIPQLIEEGKQPRVMLDYSGTLLYGLRQMGLDDVFESLATDYVRRCVSGRRSSGWETLGDMRLRLPRPFRTSACTLRPGSTTLRQFSVSKR